MEEDKTKLVEVFTGSLWEAELVKTMLGDNDVEAVLKDALQPNLTVSAIAVDVAVLVNEKDYEPAMEVVRAYEKNTNGD
ncbi:DUF2007-related protein [uncultured Bacteroides sp.]|uniref:DUF2007-related protein n=1 Tax=uncultured Bacteroides sp. TaxID=162156 RepID=UPI0025E0C61A|nr:DUF2007-related protein [uncultured Bacteroides sp.]